MNSISRRVFFAIGIGTVTAGRVQAQTEDTKLPICRESQTIGGWNVSSEVFTITAEGVPTLYDRLSISDEEHHLELSVRRSRDEVTNGILEIVILNAPQRATRRMGWEQQPFGLIIDGEPLLVGEMSLSRKRNGQTASFLLDGATATQALHRMERGSRLIVQSAIADPQVSLTSGELTNVVSAFDLTPLSSIEQRLRRHHEALEQDLRASTCKPRTSVGAGCYLTSVCCGQIGLPDDCWELRTLRGFRDDWLAHQPGGAAEIEHYYREAPGLAKRLANVPIGDCTARDIYLAYILPSVVLARLGFRSLAWRRYRAMVAYLSDSLSYDATTAASTQRV